MIEFNIGKRVINKVLGLSGVIVSVDEVRVSVHGDDGRTFKWEPENLELIPDKS